MKKKDSLKLLAALILGGIFVSCTTTPDYELVEFCLPLNGERYLFLKGEDSRLFLEPMAESLGIVEYRKIEPLLEQTNRIYLVSRGDELFIQGEGEYSRGMINLYLGTNRDWKKKKMASFSTYESESTGLQIIFPDSHFFFLSAGNLAEILSLYQTGGSSFYPFDRALEEKESLLMTVDLNKGAFLPMQDIIKTPFTMVDVALSPSDDNTFLMDVTLWGESGKGRVLGTALKIFLLTSIGRDVMKGELVTGDDFARMGNINVNLDFLLEMMGMRGEIQ